MTTGRVIAIATVSLGVGFVGGAWFIGSGLGFDLFPAPAVGPAGALASAPGPGGPGTPKAIFRRPTYVEAVSAPKPVNFSGGSGGLGPKPSRIDLLPAPGCTWIIEPVPFRMNGLWQWSRPERALGGFSAVDPETGELRFVLIQVTRSDEPAIELRPVLFDEDGNRRVLHGSPFTRSGGSNGTFAIKDYRLAPNWKLAVQDVAYFGIERVVPDAEQKLAERAQIEAKESGLQILPPLRIGERYDFDLPSIDGARVRTEDFRGKNVIIAIGGAGPFGMARFSMLSQMRKVNPPEDLAIVLVSFMGSSEESRDKAEIARLNDPIVQVPNDRKVRRIWTEGAQIDEVPKFLFLDREGTLRFINQGIWLQETVDILNGRARPRMLPFPDSPQKPPHRIQAGNANRPIQSSGSASGPKSGP